MKSVLFYSDAAEYGGHEAMTIEAVRHLLGSGFTVTFLFYSGNRRLYENLKAIHVSSGDLVLLPTDFRAKSLQALRSLISWRKVQQLKLAMRKANPDVVVVSQGRIEAGSLGLLAAKRAGYRTISYLPVAHPVSISGRPFAVGIREIINRYFYRLPDKIITISESARSMLRERGATRNIAVVPNLVKRRPIQALDRKNFREAHSLREDEYVVVTMGRIQFRDKAQDFALRAIANFRDDLRDYKFVFVGEGPDEERFKAMIADFDLSPQVKLVPWTPNPTQIYAGADMLLIPSRYEGVPLVMLEAMAYGLPIVATNVDGMAELLPPAWLFPFGDGKALTEALLRVSRSDISRLIESHRRKVATDFTAEEFASKLTAAVCE